MEDKGFPTFQYSVFLNGKDEQFVVRANSLADFKLAIADLRVLIKSIDANPKVAVENASKPTKMCQTHDLPMEQKFSAAKNKNYFVHYDEHNKPCFGFGFQS